MFFFVLFERSLIQISGLVSDGQGPEKSPGNQRRFMQCPPPKVLQLEWSCAFKSENNKWSQTVILHLTPVSPALLMIKCYSAAPRAGKQRTQLLKE